MSGVEDKVGALTPNPIPGTFVSTFLDEELGAKSFSDLLTGNGSGIANQESDTGKSIASSREEGGVAIPGAASQSFQINSYHAKKSKGLTERIAARAGFNAPKLNTTEIISANINSPSSEICSSYQTIPHGLDSPVFLSNSMALPSPTTGKFILGESKDNPFDDTCPESFIFKPHLESSSLYNSNVENKNNFQNPQEFNYQACISVSYEINRIREVTVNQRVSDFFACNKNTPILHDYPDVVGEPKGEYSSVAAETPSDDGYNWRKYGQKQVKGSEFPRSYYKCTHPTCQVRKKVERSHEGHVTEIIYRGIHNHSKPPQNRRSAIPFSDPHCDGSEYPSAQAGYGDKPLLEVTENGNTGHGADILDAASSASGVAEFCDTSSPLLTQDFPPVESPDVADVCSTLSNGEEEDDRATHGSVSLGGDGEEDETESKRRKLDTCNVEMSAASRAAREPRVVVQTTSEIDILDDGYRWRKYGQKVVKGNPNPRSYYKCTSQGCKVRKHVERASHDLKSVITTYEGKHNHEVPAARNNNSSHTSSLPSAMSVPQAHGRHWRPDPTHDNLMKLNMRMPPRGTFDLHGSFGMPQQGLGMRSLSSMSTMKPSDLPPGYSLIGGHRRAMKDESVPHSGTAMSTEALVYQQIMGRFP